MSSNEGQPFGPAQMDALLSEAFAPWIQQLGLKSIAVTPDGAHFVLPANAALSRDNGVVCGQAIAAVADTAGVLALAAANSRYRPMTTVDMTSHFMRPLMGGDVKAIATILSNGRRMATVRVDFRLASPDGAAIGKIGAAATCAYAYLGD